MALGWLGILKCLVLVLPLVSFIPEGADAAETLVRQEAGLEQLASAGSDCPGHCRLRVARVPSVPRALAQTQGRCPPILIAPSAWTGGDWNSVPGLKFPGAVAPDVKDLAGCQAFCSEREPAFAFDFAV